MALLATVPTVPSFDRDGAIDDPGPILRGKRGSTAVREDDGHDVFREALRVRVVDERGQPLAGVPVVVSARARVRRVSNQYLLSRVPAAFEPVARATTDASGRASIPGLREGRFHEIRAHPAPPRASCARVRQWIGNDEVLLVARPGVPLRVQVVDRAGAGLRAWVSATPDAFRSEADLQHRDDRSPRWAVGERETDDEGRLDLGVVPALPLRFTVFIPGVGMRGGIPVDPARQPNVTLRLHDVPGCTLFGTVSDADGTPAANAVVIVGSGPLPYSSYVTSVDDLRLAYDEPDEELPATPCTGLMAVTGADGAYELAGVAPGSLTMLQAWRADGAMVATHPFAFTQLVDVERLRADLRFGQHTWLEGRVHTHDGRPVVGARVHVSSPGALTQQVASRVGGTFATAVPRGRVFVWAYTPQLGPTPTVRGDLNAAAPEPFRLVFPKPKPVFGVVRDEAGQVVAGAQVRVVPEGDETPGPVVITDDAGAFRFEAVGRRRVFIQAVRGAVRGSAHASKRDHPVEITLRPSTPEAAIVVRVEGATESRPALVQLVRGSSTQSRLTREYGDAVFRHLKPGRYAVAILDAFQRIAGDTVDVDAAAGEQVDVVIAAPQLHALEGVVCFPGGAPAPYRGVKVRLPAWESPGQAAGRDTSRTCGVPVGRDGRFALAALLPGDYVVQVAHADPVSIRIPCDPLTVTVPHPRHIRGTLLDPKGEPVALGRVLVHQWDDDSDPRTELNLAVSNGAFAGWIPGHGRTELQVVDARRPDGSSIAFLDDGQTPVALDQPLRIRLQPLPSSSIRGRVVDAQGQPVVGAHVRCVPFERGKRRGQGSTDERGTFAVSHLNPGRYRVSLDPPQRSDFIRPNERTLAADGPDVVIELTRGISFRGTVRGDDGKPVANRVLDVRYGSSQGSGRRRARTNQAGVFQFRGLPDDAAGSLRVRDGYHKPQPFLPWRAKGIRFAEHADGYEVRLRRALRITGRVDGLDDADATSCSVHAQRRVTNGGKKTWRTVAGGSVRLDRTFLINRLPPGTYRVVVSVPDGYRAVGSAEARAGDRDLVLAVRRVRKQRLVVRGELRTDTVCDVIWLPGGGGDPEHTMVDSSGTFAIETKSASGVVFIRHPNENLIEWRTAVRAGDRVHQFALREGGIVEGRIDGVGADTVANGTLLLSVGGQYELDTDVRDDGSFRFTHVPPGAHRLHGHFRISRGRTRLSHGAIRELSVSAGARGVVVEHAPKKASR